MSARILVVEDERHLAEGIAENLEAEGYEVEIVGDGESALTRWREGGIDLIVLDVMLPRRDGFSVCEVIRAEGGTVSILFLTAKSSTDDRIRGLDAGGDDYLGKPFEPIPQLLAIAEYITKTLAICMRCGNPANHTQRLVTSHERVVVGGSEAYEARCRRCFEPGPATDN